MLTRLDGKRRRAENFCRRAFVSYATLGLVMLLGIPLAGQQAPFPQFPPGSGPSPQSFPDSSDPYGQDRTTPDNRRIQLLNEQRQKDLVSETEKLLKLAKELNDEVAASGSDSLSGQQLRKVAEIGKLAKSVKEKMSFSVGGYPSVTSPLTISPGVQ